MIIISVSANFVLLAIIIYLIVSNRKEIEFYRRLNELTFKDWNESLTKWNIERQQLLDRIQAPSFAEYKQAEIKMVKAQKDEEPKPSFILE